MRPPLARRSLTRSDMSLSVRRIWGLDIGHYVNGSSPPNAELRGTERPWRLGRRRAAVLTFFHSRIRWERQQPSDSSGRLSSGEGRQRAALIEIHLAATAAARLARPWRHGCADRPSPRRDRSPGPKSRPGQNGAAVVCGYVLGVPSQPTRPRPRPVPSHADDVPEGALLDQFKHRLGTRGLSGLGRCATRRPAANRRQKTVA